jgi:DNA invertase Pin-like site-specific DNA recombinase
MSKQKRVAFYLRVSTSDQTTDNQIQALQAVADQRGWRVVEVYKDEGISGAKGRDKRPGYDRMLRDAGKAKFDALACWAIDRLGRSVKGLIDTAEALRTSKVDLVVLDQGIDTSTAAGEAFYGFMAIMAQLERKLLIERIRAGQKRARAAGKHLGGNFIAPDKDAAVRAALAAPNRPGFRAIAAACGVSLGTVAGIAKSLQGEVAA